MGPYPQLILKNQFGEESINAVLGGSDHIDIDFIVDHANGNGLGIRSLKQGGQAPIIANVFMNTSATPAAGSPNPLPGYILVELANPYLGYEGGYWGVVSPLSGTNINITSGVTQGQPYVITSIGTTTAAQWQAIGLPLGITPAVGVGFIASVTGDGVGTGTVQVPLATGSKIDSIEVVGDPNQSCNPSTGGAWIVLQCLAATSAGVTTKEAVAPADGTVIGLRFVMTGAKFDV